VKQEKEAQEAGILMPVKRKTLVDAPRQRGLNTAAGVGKFRNGMLQISERDIRRINSKGGTGARRGKGIKKLFK
jgi:molybdate-binding protein